MTITKAGCERTLGAASGPVILRLVRRDDAANIPRRHEQHPTWCWLYAIAFLTLAVLATIDYLLPDGLASSLGDVLVVVGCIGLIRLWLGTNRCRLVRRAEQAQQADHAPVNEKAGHGGTSSRSASLWVGQ